MTLKLSILAVMVLCFATDVLGHAIVLEAAPGKNAVVNGPDVPVKLRFNSRIDAKRSRLILLDPDGQQRTLVIADVPGGDSLVSEAKGLKSGAYVLRWQVLASDGHITRGEVPFSVK